MASTALEAVPEAVFLNRSDYGVFRAAAVEFDPCAAASDSGVRVVGCNPRQSQFIGVEFFVGKTLCGEFDRVERIFQCDSRDAFFRLFECQVILSDVIENMKRLFFAPNFIYVHIAFFKHGQLDAFEYDEVGFDCRVSVVAGGLQQIVVVGESDEVIAKFRVYIGGFLRREFSVGASGVDMETAFEKHGKERAASRTATTRIITEAGLKGK